MMGSSYGDALLDFDLNLLHPSSNNTVVQSKLDKQRRANLIIKKKIIATDSLIKKYHTKKDELDATEKNLFASKEECKQICLDYRKSLDSCSVLENDKLILQNTNKELSEKCFQLENQLGASKSHTHQLQTLVKEYEGLIESLKVENKSSKSNAKECEKKLLSVQKESKTLIQHILLAKDVISGKKRLRSSHKALLERYDKYETEYCEDNLFGAVSSEEDDFDDTPLSPFYEDDNTIKQIDCDQVSKSPDTTTRFKPPSTTHMSRSRNNIKQDIEYSNDLGSVDTGRGSSLALSDSDKYSHSTDYFINDSPLSDVSIANSLSKKLVDAATSPVPTYNTTHTATSPIEFEKFSSVSVDDNQNNSNCRHSLPDVFNIKESANIVMVDRAISPIALHKTIERAVSPISNLHTDVATSPLQFNKDHRNNITECEETEQLKECLELNSSNNLCEESDGEIQLILSRMRMDYELITPIPLTPVKSQCANKMDVSLASKHTEHLSIFTCPGAALAREETKELEAIITKLAKDIHTIKNVLRIQSSSAHNNEGKSIINNYPVTEDNELNVSHPIGITSPIVDNSENYESYTLSNQEIPITNRENELEVIDSNVPLQISPNRLHSSFSTPEIEIDNEFDSVVESPDNCTKTIEYLQNNEEEMTPQKLQLESPVVYQQKSPVVRCEKLDLSRVNEKVNNTENEYQLQSTKRKIGKSSKLTRLGKFKRGILPKYKIREDYLRPSKRSQVKQRKIILPKRKKIITDQDCSVTLNDKSIYQKAINVMAALKIKQKYDSAKSNHNISTDNKKNIDVNNKENAATKIEKRLSVDQKDNEDIEKVEFDNESSPSLKKSITTRSRSRYNIQNNTNSETDKDIDQDNVALSELCNRKGVISPNEPILQETRKRLRSSEDSFEIPNKRLLRSSVNHNNANATANNNNTDAHMISPKNTYTSVEANKSRKVIVKSSTTTQESGISDNTIISNETEKHDSNTIEDNNPKQSILCVMIEKYGVQTVKYCVNKFSESIIDSIAKRIEEQIVNIIELPYNETKDAMNKLVVIIEKWNIKHFVTGLMKYLQDPARKLELFKTLEVPPAPPMTKSEQVLLYIVAQLNNCMPKINIVDKILSSIEYTLFSLNRTPHFGIIESMSHFYAVICRYFKLKSRLRLFMLDAMYCIQHKSITLVKQCLNVWTHILPLAHMGIAKNPLVTCLVYLLHFYKCEDRFNKVRDIRIMLNRNYFYKFTDWNENQILEMFRNSIKGIKNPNKGNSVQRKMLRIALIILAKRQGTKWCQNNIIKKLLQPIIEDDKMQDNVKEFCVSLLGPLMKPYPIDMKVHCEVVMNQLFNMLQNKPSPNMTESIMTSLIYMNKHNQHRVIEAMISWSPSGVSYEFEEIVRGFVKSKPIKAWKTTLARIPL